MPGGRIWTPEEDAWLRRAYYQAGSARATELFAERFGHVRTRAAIMARMPKLGAHRGIPKGYVPLVDVHPAKQLQCPATAALNAARRDGVLQTFVTSIGSGKTRCVPADWAEAYAKRLAREEEELAATRTWWHSKRVAAEYGVSVARLQDARTQPTRPLFPYVAPVRVAKVRSRTGRSLRWHPDDTRAHARRWRAAHTPAQEAAA